PVLPHRGTGRDRQSQTAARRVMNSLPLLTAGMNSAILRVEGLRVAYDHPQGIVRAVDDVSFALRPHERFGLAGESGSGKSTMALAILRLIRPPGHIDGGDVWLDDQP